jgi:CRP-like cAMP-binding protein
MDILQYLQLFHPISESEFDLLEGYFREKSFKKGYFLAEPGKIQKELYFVKEGVQMSYAEIGEKSHVIAFTYPINLCAIPESFMFQKPATYFLKCMTASCLECISFEHLQQVFDQSQAIERLFRKMTEAVLAGMINRHIQLQTLTIEERFRIFCQRSPHLLQLVPHKYIASYLGIDPTNFSKLFNSVKL